MRLCTDAISRRCLNGMLMKNVNRQLMYITKILTFIFAVTVTIATIASAESEREILELFFNTTDGPRWKKSTNWLDPNVSICKWYGVRCKGQSEDQGVVSLTLANNRLSGEQPYQLFALPDLQELHLGSNSLSEFSFLGLTKAPKLAVLDVSNNGITSVTGLSYALPALTSINLAKNKLRGRMPPEIYNLFGVKYLYLGNNEMRRTIPTEIGLLGLLGKIEILDLAGNFFSGQIPTQMGQLQDLKELYLSENRLTGNIPNEMNNLSHLRALALHRTGKNSVEGKKYVLSGPLPTFKGLSLLQRLVLAGNSFDGPIPKRLLNSTLVGDMKVKIDLSDNELTGELPQALGDRFDRLFLDVTGNYIEKIPESLCLKTQWMGGDVSVYGCDAILCPIGTFSREGRQTTANSTCVPCNVQGGIPNFLGMMECASDAPKEVKYTDKQILQSFFDSMGGDSWIKKTNWNDPKVSICNWYGVICKSEVAEYLQYGGDQNFIRDDDAPGETVIGLSLEANELKGEFPSDIYNLPSLVFLDLSGNVLEFSFDGISNSNIAQLVLTQTNLKSVEGLKDASSLRTLWLDRNELSGTFPRDILSLENLHRLRLDFNMLSGSLPSEIGNLKNLNRLHMYGNMLNNTLPSELGLLTLLVTLDLAENAFSGPLPTELNELTRLKHLSLHQSTKDGRGFNGKILDFSKLTQVEELFLDSNDFTGKIPESFLSGVVDKNQTVDVSLSWNNLEGTVPASLDSFTHMNIEMVGNQISGIAPELCDNKEWMNGLVEKFGCDAILCPAGTYNSDGLVWNPNDLCSSCVSSKVYGSVICDLTTNTDAKPSPERIYLESMFYATGGRSWKIQTNWTVPWIPVCSWLGIKCKDGDMESEEGVEEINVNYFGLGGTVPDGIFSLPYLKRLNLNGNKVDINVQYVGNASSLVSLSLSDTGLSSITGLGNAINLRELDLSNNFLSSAFPSEVLNLEKLVILDLADNKMTGKIPRSLRNLQKLQHLNCQDNRLSGQLPRSMVELTELRTLFFGKNHLTGQLPLFLNDMIQLRIIDLSSQQNENGITGKVLDFSKLLRLTQLLLDDNSLTGSIPQTFIANDILKEASIMIDLSFNQLTGTLPAELAKFNRLDINLVGNQIVKVPDQLCANDDWMSGNVAKYQCDAILCPIGTANIFGRRDNTGSMCEECGPSEIAPFMGSVECWDDQQVQRKVEREILMEFYKSSGGRLWPKKKNWMDEDTSICEWYGITCSSDIGGSDEGVIEVRLPNNGVTNKDGKSPILDLPSLKVLDLSNNENLNLILDDTMKSVNLEVLIMSDTRMQSLSGIESLVKLKHLNVAGNHITGSIPDKLFDLVQLEGLYLTNNYFEGHLSEKIGQLKNLKNLYLVNNGLFGPIPAAIGQLTDLMNLRLEENSFTGNLPPSLNNLANARTLGFGYQRTAPGLTGPLLDFKDLSYLSYLSLQSNSLTGKIPSTLLTNSKLKSTSTLVSVDIRNNDLSGAVPTQLQSFTNLEIKLAGNQITDLPASLCGKSLWMRGAVGSYQCDGILCPAGHFNSIGRQSAADSPCQPCDSLKTSNILGSTECEMLNERETLKKLFTDTNGKEWSVATHWNDENEGICHWYGVFCDSVLDDDEHGVVEIVLDGSPLLDGKGAIGNGLRGTIPHHVFKLPLLKKLYLKGNEIDIDFATIEGNPSVEVLYLSETSISSIEGIGIFKNLHVLHLTESGVGGDIDDIFDLKNLREAYISYNDFTGKISRIGHLTELQKFYAIDNKLSGSIPPTIGSASNLETFVISGNYFTGIIPTSMNFLEKLKIFASLNKRENGPGFTGKLIDFSQTKMNELILNNNALTGSIPETFLVGSSMSQEMVVWLANNMLTGSVPAELDRFENIDFRVYGNQIQSLPTQFCDNEKWMTKLVKSFQCDAILCPTGFYNYDGRQTSPESPCLPCEEAGGAPYLGSVTCVPNYKSFSERDILKKLYLATGGDSWINKENWYTEDVICKWYGITCEPPECFLEEGCVLDYDSGVTGIDLLDNGLTGSVPPEIFLLPNLKHLNMESSRIDVDFKELRNARNLEELTLSKTQLTSLKGIGGAKSLKKLHLINAGLRGELPTELFELAKLEELFLSYNMFSGVLPSEIGKLKQLKELMLYDNSLSGSIPSEVGHLTGLIALILSENKFTGALPTEIGNLVNIDTISIHHREARGPGLIGPIPDFSRLKKVKKIYLDHNNLSGTIPETFLDAVDNGGWIDVDISWNQLEGKVPLRFERFQRLIIRLSGNMITTLPNEFCDNYLWMDGEVKKYGCDAILCPQGTYNDDGRQVVQRDPCQKCKDGTVTHYMGSTRCVMSERAILKKFYDKCGGDSWVNRHGWKTPNVSHCTWDGVSCGSDNKVSEILLGSNQVVGTPPKELFDLPKLSSLWLYSNPVQFSFKGIENARRLKSLLLDSTGFKSMVGLERAIHLREFGFRFNQMGGTIPTELNRLLNLEFLSLSENKLTGSVPDFLGKMARLKKLRLDTNKLGGKLPSFKYVPNMLSLDLSDNMLSGTIPEEFLLNTNTKSIIIADLSSNALTGTVPAGLSRLERLSVSLQDNRLEAIAPELCFQTNWNNGDVGRFQCEAIACPPGTFNELGRQKSKMNPCVRCDDALYLGSIDCLSANLGVDPSNTSSSSLSEDENFDRVMNDVTYIALLSLFFLLFFCSAFSLYAKKRASNRFKDSGNMSAFDADIGVLT